MVFESLREIVVLHAEIYAIARNARLTRHSECQRHHAQRCFRLQSLMKCVRQRLATKCGGEWNLISLLSALFPLLSLLLSSLIPRCKFLDTTPQTQDMKNNTKKQPDVARPIFHPSALFPLLYLLLISQIALRTCHLCCGCVAVHYVFASTVAAAACATVQLSSEFPPEF